MEYIPTKVLNDKINAKIPLTQFENIYSYSLDIGLLMQDLLTINHNMIMAKTLNNFFEITHLPTDQVNIIRDTITKVNLHSLMRIWKLLLNGENELRSNFDSKKVMDILLVNICYASRLPSLSDILKKEELKIENQKELQEEKANDDIIKNITNLFDGAKIISENNV